MADPSFGFFRASDRSVLWSPLLVAALAALIVAIVGTGVARIDNIGGWERSRSSAVQGSNAATSVSQTFSNGMPLP